MIMLYIVFVEHVFVKLMLFLVDIYFLNSYFLLNFHNVICYCDEMLSK
jgi:hypothetical protein